MDILDLSHSFGREIETSANKLFNFFCNNVNFGQWQLTKTCLKQLIQDKKILCINLNEIFESIIKNPEIYCHRSVYFKSPFYLAYLLSRTVLENNSEFQIEGNLKKLIELKIILYSIYSEIVNNNFLIKQFQTITDEFEKLIYDRINNFDPEIQIKICSTEFFKSMIIYDAFKAKKIISLLNLKNTIIENNLIEYHFQLLDNSLEILQYNFEEKCIQIISEPISKIFSQINLLLVYNFDSFNTNKKGELIAIIQSFYKKLCFKLKASFTNNYENLERCITKVQLALFKTNHDSSLLEIFIKISHELDRQTMAAKIFGNENFIILSSITHSLSIKNKSNDLWKILFFFISEEKRCLIKSLIDECLILISKNHLDFLSSIFSIKELYFIKPILLFIGISKMNDVNSVKKLVNLLNLDCKKHLFIGKVGIFKTHLEFISWFLKQNKCHNKILFFDQVIRILQKKLPINIINDYFNLNQIEYNQIIKVLCNTLIERDNLVETKCVRFIDEIDQNISPIQANCLNIFNGFYCINQILKCILFCCENLNDDLYNSFEFTNKKYKRTHPLMDVGKINSNKGSSKPESKTKAIKHFYQENVVQILEHVKKVISRIEAMDYRLEILENIYTLIFLRSDDILKSSEESDHTIDDHENGFNQIILSENFKTNSFDDFEILETFDKEIETSIYEPLSSNQFISNEEIGLKISLDTSNEKNSRSSRISKNENRKENDDILSNQYRNFTKYGGFLTNDFLCRDILLFLKDCLTSFSLIDSKIDDYQNISSRSKKLLQLVNETWWRFQLVKSTNVSTDYGQINVLNYNSKYLAYDCEQNLVYQLLKKQRQRHDSNASNISNYNSIQDENASLSLVRSFKNSNSKINNCHQSKEQRRSLESTRSLSLIYPKINNKKANYIAIKLLSDVKTLSVICLKEFKHNEAKQLIKLFSIKKRNLFEFEQIIFNEIFKNSIDEILRIDHLINESIHEQSLFSLNISKIIENLIQTEKGKPLIQSLLICDLLATIKIPINIIFKLKEFILINLNQKVSENFQNPEIENLNQSIYQKIISYINSITVLESKTKSEFCLKKQHFLDYLITFDGISVFAKNSYDPEAKIPFIVESICHYLELISQIDLHLEELELNDEKNFDQIVNNLNNKLKDNFDFLDCYIFKSKKTENFKYNFSEIIDDNKDFYFKNKDISDKIESNSIEPSNIYNYLMAFNEYIKKLSEYLKEKSVHKKFDSNLAILDFSPASLICKMLFDDLLKPESIVHITNSLNLNLIAIILHNSCPRLKLINTKNKSICIPKNDNFRLNSHLSVYRNEFFYSILNENSVFSCLIMRPHEFIKDLLFNMLKYFRSYSDKNINAKLLMHIYNSPDFKKILKQTQQLQNLNLDYLQTNNEKLSFFINLYNLLSIHANIFLISIKFSKTNKGRKKTIQNTKLILNENLNLEDTSEIILHNNNTFKMLFQQKLCYKVGQMGCVSLFDLKHFILLRRKNVNQFNSIYSFDQQLNSSPIADLKDFKKKSLLNRISPLKLAPSLKTSSNETEHLFNLDKNLKKKPFKFSLFELDLNIEPSWSKYIPNIMDVRVIFCLADCVQSDPPIRVYESDNSLDDQLQIQMKMFLNQTVYADIKKEILYVPSLLLENLVFFSYQANFENFLTLNVEYKNELENLVKFLIDQVNDELREKISKLLVLDSIHYYGENIDEYGRKELPFQISELNVSDIFCLVLDENLLKDKTNWYQNEKDRILVKYETDESKQNVQVEKQITHNRKLLNKECLEYISNNSPLILKNLGFLFDVKIRDSFFTEISEICVKNLIENETNINNLKNNFLNRYIQLYVPLEFMHHLNMDLKLDMVTQFLLNSKAEEFKIENIIDLANYYSLKHEWKNVIDLIEDCTQDNEEFYDFRETSQGNNLEFSVQFVTQINYLNVNSKFIQKDIYNLFDHACLSFANQEAKNFDKAYCYLFKMNNFIRQIRAVFGLMDQWSIDGCLELIGFCIKKCQFFEMNDFLLYENENENSLIDILQDKRKEFSAYKDLITCAQNVLEKYYEHQQIQDAAGFYDSNYQKSFSSTNELDRDFNLSYFNKIKKVCQRCLTWQYAKAQLESSRSQDDEDTKELIIDLFLLNDKFISAKYLIRKYNLNEKLQFKIEFGHLKFRLLNLNAVSSIIEIDFDSILKECISFSKNTKIEYDLYLFKICFKLINELKYFNDLNNQVLITLCEFLIKNFIDFLNNDQLNELKIIQLTAKIFQILVQDENIYFESYKRHHSQPIFIIEQLLMNGKIYLCAKTIKLCRDLLKDKKLNHNINQLLVKYAHKALEFQIFTGIRKDCFEQENNQSPTTQISKISPIKMGSIINAASSPSRNTILSNFKAKTLLFEENSPKIDNNFKMPVIPPNKEDWIKDEEVNDCMVCKVSKFSLMNRRHHCRRCGRVVCGPCSQKTTLIQNVAKRTCDDCFHQLKILKESEFFVSDEIKSKSFKRRSLVLSQKYNSDYNDENKINYYLIGNNENETSIKRDKEVRENFRYSQAPSTSLCLSILDLHDNLFECGKSLLSMCDDLSLYLQNANQQEDHGLVINIIKHLIQNAKVKLLQNSSSNIISLCDSYLSLIDILQQLLLANCSIIPSLNELMNNESVRRIRNRLLEEERHELAMNLSTKCGLDTQTVWASWGLVELRRSNFKEARNKFEKCLKPVSDKHPLNNSTNLKILNDILNFFETTAPVRKIKNIKSLLSQPLNVENLVFEPKNNIFGSGSLNNEEFEESMFYLKTYGTHYLMVSFFQRNGLLKNAIEYLVENKCNAEIFLEAILITSLKSGDFFPLVEMMISLEKIQYKLYPYYSAIGKFLEKNGFINTLYDFQIQMKDFVRSCMSCIYFFTKNANKYSDLYRNLHFLRTARKHLEQYLESIAKKQNTVGSQSWKIKNDNNIRKQMSAQEIDSYKNAIDLQIEVTKFIYNFEEKIHNDGKLFTLFGNNDAKISLCCQILLVGNSVQEGYGFVIRIIQCFNLNSTLVYSQISRELSKKLNFKEINNLLKCIDESGYKEDKNLTYDECISTCIRVFATTTTDNQTVEETNNGHQQLSKYSRDIENLIQLMKNDENKINAYILIGKLKSAYLIAIRHERLDIVRHITSVAERLGQNLIRDICIKWLEKNSNK